ncbi:tetratricopeptide repeat protein [Gillisia hiemivivida]|uniref:Tetratricopeptide repeat protein n=1 Tax=Gillisia hiemivivida TaxID=291190 RepID=A0A5C6ZYW0_9FLAO|nr:tetratricopeptide repeat protein [Gillisia hiemivivida]TXD95604.1 tetratricopeptide repeat protein [Gillisia hiemivivida]
MKRILFLLLLICAPMMGQNKALFEKANTAYNAGNYPEAVSRYTEVLKNGEESAELYFNLGNAHYKLNHIAESVYNYEKALLLDPADQTIKNNLEFASNMVLDDIKVVPKSGLSNFITNAISIFSFNGWAWIAILGSAIFSILFLLYYFSIASKWKRVFFTVAITAVVISFISLIFGFYMKNDTQNREFAIVFAEEVPVRNEPNLRGNELFMLHEGTKVQILNTFQDWVQLELANGSTGWMDKSSVKFL